MWENGEYFKLRVQKGRCIQVAFFYDRNHWISTKTNDYQKAQEFATDYLIARGQGRNLADEEITLGKFASDFYKMDSKTGYARRKEQFGHKVKDTLLENKQKFLENYVLPTFKNMPLKAINVRVIEDWIFDLKPVRKSQKELAPATKVKIAAVLEDIMNEAVRNELIDRNPFDYVETIKPETVNKKEAFSEEDMKKMFPDEVYSMICIWGDLQTALYYSILADTGFRPGEALGLSVDDYYPEFKGFYTTGSVDVLTGRYQATVKTSEKGYKYRMGYASERTVRLIGKLLEDESVEFFFESGRSFMNYQTLSYRLKGVAEKLELSIQEPSPYYFRHTFMSNVTTKFTEDETKKLMGHTSYRKEYDHATPEARLAQLADKRSMIVGN